jgi:hypothetical protein
MNNKINIHKLWTIKRKRNNTIHMQHHIKGNFLWLVEIMDLTKWK